MPAGRHAHGRAVGVAHVDQRDVAREKVAAPRPARSPVPAPRPRPSPAASRAGRGRGPGPSAARPRAGVRACAPRSGSAAANEAPAPRARPSRRPGPARQRQVGAVCPVAERGDTEALRRRSARSLAAVAPERHGHALDHLDRKLAARAHMHLRRAPPLRAPRPGRAGRRGRCRRTRPGNSTRHTSRMASVTGIDAPSIVITRDHELGPLGDLAAQVLGALGQRRARRVSSRR